jgi:hypothetical protein
MKVSGQKPAALASKWDGCHGKWIYRLKPRRRVWLVFNLVSDSVVIWTVRSIVLALSSGSKAREQGTATPQGAIQR